MDLYRVIAGPIEMGPGQVFSLDAGDQMRRRGHRVRRIEAHKVDVGGKATERVVVIADELLQFKTGEVIGLSELEPRLKDRVEKIEVAKPVADSPKVKAASGSRNSRRADIIRAIGQLDQGNRKHFTSDGVPAVKAIEAVAGFQISAQERDAAWRSMTAK